MKLELEPESPQIQPYGRMVLAKSGQEVARDSKNGMGPYVPQDIVNVPTSTNQAPFTCQAPRGQSG